MLSRKRNFGGKYVKMDEQLTQDASKISKLFLIYRICR
jgi:hypothetical protein